jgi:hypothetical protein
MFNSFRWTKRQIHCKQLANNSFENVAKYKSLGVTLTNGNSIDEEIKSKIGLLSVYYSAVPGCHTKMQRVKCGTENLPRVLHGVKISLSCQRKGTD